MPNNFPHDIVIDILLKLPVKSLLRFKSDRYYSIDAPLQHDSAVSPIEPPPGFNHLFISKFVNSCNGLFLLVFPPKNHNFLYYPALRETSKIVLWNPALRESRIIPRPIPIEGNYRSYSKYGLGYVSSLNDYKIVRVGYCRHPVQIFSTKSDSWKLVGKLPLNIEASIGRIVVADGIAYIILRQPRQPPTWSSSRSMIICLCSKNENFEEILFPHSDLVAENVSLYAVGESLLAMFWTKFFKENVVDFENIVDFEVWCLKKDGLMSWSKILAITEPGPVSFRADEDMLFFSWDKGGYMCYDFKSQKFEEFKVCEVKGLEARRKLKQLKIVWPQAPLLIHRAVPYVETLISPNAI
ncbi:F-box protein CPR1-like [Lycium ferocissimum]|uniref:F-box protein CPR1-like n=1 Tax=Lycium ferocissimum TaxID=112874 RepID=UPI002815D2AC|nr:F-box protein CPR1-like [Lycium ferocissimum]